MTSDIAELNYFYQTSLGQSCTNSIQAILHELCPCVKGLSLLGIGYTLPYLANYYNEAERTLAFMPSRQGVTHWPDSNHNLTCLVDETTLPLPDNSIDRIIIIHALEHAESVRPFLREIWRILAANGKIIIIAPNRRGLWARFDNTPFGHGNPYTLSQLSYLLRENQFNVTQSCRGLYAFPSYSPLATSLSKIFDPLPKSLISQFSGIIAVEAIKQIYSAYPIRSKKTATVAGFVGSTRI